jgi:phosphatidylserine/phosphatidylglycerophosphate/cardiolipin synthase-like enzyme
MEEPSRPLIPMSSEYDASYVAEASEGRRATSTSLSLTTGTGYTIYKSTIIPAILATEQELKLVTCFWAASATRDLLNHALKQLSENARSSSRKISVSICFSSSSLARNMLLPTPKQGQHYPPASWRKLGLPDPNDLTGLDLTVTRKFFWPFGIIHSKYVIVDRKLAIFPSCNVSWERWFEAAICCKGSVVEHLLSFHREFWEDSSALSDAIEPSEIPGITTSSSLEISAPTTLLPSPHTSALLPEHLQPEVLLGHCPCLPDSVPHFSPTPLLKTTYHILSTARSSIIILTPNLTEPTVMQVLLEALGRGVSVRIWTNRNLMTAEQLVTAGTTTPSCIKRLQRDAEKMTARGLLKVSYFDSEDGPGAQHPVLRQVDHYREAVPVKLHAKVTIVDGERILLGSGNMDAASWKTSQELGVLIESRAVVDEFVKQWNFDKLEV